jgi:NADH-quinone oxidoreductase subunit G
MAAARGGKLWKLDEKAPVRFSHENPEIQALYRTYLKAPLGERAHHLLHTDHDGWDARH